MSITSVISRMAMAGKLTVDQLRQSIQSGSLPAYIGIPMIEEKNKEKEQMAAAQQGFPEEQKSPSVAAQILQKAEQGVEQLPSNLPVSQDMAGGGIIAFAEGGDAEDFDVEAYREQQDEDEYADALRSFMAASEAAGEEGISSRRKKDKKYADGGITGLNNGGAIRFQNRGLVDDPNVLDVFEKMRIEDPEGYARMAQTMGLTRMRREIPAAPASHATYVEPRLSVEQQAGMNDPMVDIGMMRGTPDAGMPSTAPTLSPVVVTPANASPERPSMNEVDYSMNSQEGTGRLSGEMPKVGINNLPAASTTNPAVPGAPQGNVAPMSQGADQTGKPRSAYDDFLDEIRAGREDLKTQAQKDKYMALVSAGLGMMSGTSPNAFANIGQGAQAGIASYMASGKQRAAEKAALNKNLLMGRRYQSMEDVANRTADIQERRYAAIAAARGAGGDSKAENLERQRLSDIGNLHQRRYATLSAAVQKIDPMLDKKGYEAALKRLQDDPLLNRYNTIIENSLNNMYGITPEAPTAGSGGTRLKFDKNGNIIQ